MPERVVENQQRFVSRSIIPTRKDELKVSDPCMVTSPGIWPAPNLLRRRDSGGGGTLAWNPVQDPSPPVELRKTLVYAGKGARQVSSFGEVRFAR